MSSLAGEQMSKPGPREIPGFFYDQTKRRYFQIQANHVARASSSGSPTKYSRETINADKVIQKAQRTEKARKKAVEAATVKRSKLHLNPVLDLDARLGIGQKACATTIRDWYVGSLEGRCAFGADGLEIGSRTQIGEQFHVDENGILATSASVVINHGITSMHDIAQFFEPDEESETLYPKVSPTPGIPFSGFVDSIVRLPAHNFTAWAHRENQRQSISAKRHSSLTLTCSTHSNSGRGTWANRLRTRGYIRRLAASPSSDLLAVAFDNHVKVMSEIGNFESLKDWATGLRGGVMDVAFSDDNNLLLVGSAHGAVYLYDLRLPPGSDKGVVRAQHDQNLSHLRSMKQHQILAHGLTTTSIYDLRWCPQPQPKTRDQDAHNARSPKLVDFHVPADRRQNRAGMGFAYDAELNLVFGASTDHQKHHRANLWDAGTGRLLTHSPLVQHEFASRITCAQFVEVRPQAKSLLLATDALVQEWSPF